MPGYAPISPTVGMGPFNELIGAADAVQRFQLGVVCDAVDAYFGYGRFMYACFKGSSALTSPGRVVTIKDQTFEFIDYANTASLAQPILVTRNTYPISNVTTTYGWLQFEGLCPVQTAASVAQGAALGIGGAGQLGAYSTLKGVVGARVMQASTFTLTKTGQTINGDTRLGLPNVDGLFAGLAVSGTGIAASSTISTIDPSGRFVILNNACTATGAATITFTYTNFLLCHINTPSGSSAVA